MENSIFEGMEYTYAVYKAGGFRKAADELYISQPSISASVKRIEEKIGRPIFDRSAKPLKLTRFGEHYMASVEKIMAMERELMEFIQDSSEINRGHLVVGGSSLFSSLFLPPIIQRFNQLHPNISIEMIEETTPNLETMLETGTVDLVLDFSLPNLKLYDGDILEEDRLLIAVPNSFPINEKLKAHCIPYEAITKGEDVIDHYPPLPLDTFDQLPFILLKNHNRSRRSADNIIRHSGFQPNVLLEFDQQLSSFLACCSGMGICFVSSSMIRRIANADSVSYYAVNTKHSRHSVCLYWRKGRYLSNTINEFRKVARETTQTISKAQTTLISAPKKVE